MDLRLVKVRVPSVMACDVREALEATETVEIWENTEVGSMALVEVLVRLEGAEAVVSALEERFGRTTGFRVVLLNVEAAVPRVPDKGEAAESEEETTEEGAAEAQDEQQEDEAPTPPINIEELYSDVTAGVEISWIYAVMAALSAIVAAVGLVRNDVAIVIAAMIIAPLLGPNVSMSLAATLGDVKLGIRSLRVNLLGFGVAFVVAYAFGWFVPFDPTVQQIAARTQVGILEMILAGAAGAAGALSFTTGQAGRVVGVMVAVALIPPVVSFGMLAGRGLWTAAFGALYLTIVNLVCLNLAGIVSFFAQRIRPRTAWESERASRSFWVAVTVWVVLLGLLVAMMLFGGEYSRYP